MSLTIISNLLVIHSYEPGSFTIDHVFPSLLLPASHRHDVIATMSQLTSHITSVLWCFLITPDGYHHLFPYLFLSLVGLYEISLGKTICFPYMPTLVHHTPKHTSSFLFISMFTSDFPMIQVGHRLHDASHLGSPKI